MGKRRHQEKSKAPSKAAHKSRLMTLVFKAGVALRTVFAVLWSVLERVWNWSGLPKFGLVFGICLGFWTLYTQILPRIMNDVMNSPPELANVSEQATLPPSQDEPPGFDRTINETDRRLDAGEEINTTVLLKQGNVLFTTGEYTKAEHYYEVAEDIARQQQDIETVTLAIQNKALLVASLGRYAEALEIIRRDSTVIQSMSDSSIIAEYYNNLGVIHFEQGDYKSSETLFRRALEVSSISGYTQGHATALGYVGIFPTMRGQVDSGLTMMLVAAELCASIGFERGLSVQYGNLSSQLFQTNQTGMALVYARRALEIAYRLPFRLGIALGEINLSNHYSSVGQFDSALDALDSAGAAYQQMGATIGEIEVLGRAAWVRLSAGDTAAALAGLLDARELSREQPRTECSLAKIAFFLGKLSYETGNLSTSESYYREALAAAESCGHSDWQVGSWSGLGSVLRARREYDSALTAHLKSHNLAIDAQLWSGATKAAYNIGVIYEEMHQDSLALVYLDHALAVAVGHALVEERQRIQSTIDDIQERISESSL